MRIQRSSPKISAQPPGRRTFGIDASPQTSHWTNRSLVQTLGASQGAIHHWRQAAHRLAKWHNKQIPSLWRGEFPAVPSIHPRLHLWLCWARPPLGRCGEGALAAFSSPGADVIYEVQVTLGSSEHLFCRGLRGVLLTWEEFILTVRNWGRLAQHILSLGVVNCWNSLLPFGMLQRREEGLYDWKLMSVLAWNLDCNSQEISLVCKQWQPHLCSMEVGRLSPFIFCPEDLGFLLRQGMASIQIPFGKQGLKP